LSRACLGQIIVLIFKQVDLKQLPVFLPPGRQRLLHRQAADTIPVGIERRALRRHVLNAALHKAAIPGAREGWRGLQVSQEVLLVPAPGNIDV
jgi:hypothetical protein